MIPEGWLRAALSPPRAWDDGQLATGVLRAGPEDFVVEEILGFAASGSGPHALLRSASAAQTPSGWRASSRGPRDANPSTSGTRA
jgi:hypothetical protein